MTARKHKTMRISPGGDDLIAKYAAEIPGACWSDMHRELLAEALNSPRAVAAAQARVRLKVEK